MKLKARLLTFSAVLALIASGTYGAETYSLSLKAGDDLRGSRSHQSAITAYETALSQAANDTEKALALSKIAEVYSIDLNNCDKALEYANRAIMLPAEPVGRVTALQVSADCNMKIERNQAAINALEEAIGLSGVDWAMPRTALKLGDAYRATSQFEKAVSTYKRVLGMDTDNNAKGVAQLNIAMTYQYNLNDAGSARIAYSEAGKLNPGLSGEIAGHLSRIQ